MMPRRRNVLIAITAIGVALPSGCVSDLAADDVGGEDFTIGIADEAPYAYMGADGKAEGFGPEIAGEVFTELGLPDPEFIMVDFGDLSGKLQSHQFRMVAAGMYITPGRMEQIQFSDPVYCVFESLAVPKGNPDEVTDHLSLAGTDLTVAVAKNTAQKEYLADAGVSDEQIKPFATIKSMYQALQDGEVDVVTGTGPTVETQVAETDGIEAVERFLPKDAHGAEVYPCGAFSFRLDDTEFRDKFNAKLNELRKDGTTLDIIVEGEGDFTKSNVDLANALTVADFEQD